MSRYHNTGRDDWSTPRQRRHADFGHGKIVRAREARKVEAEKLAKEKAA